MISQGKHFRNLQVELDGSTFVNCTFEHCVLSYSGLMPIHFQGNTVTSCRWHFLGNALNTITFMAEMYAQGGVMTELVEKMFEDIRTKAAARLKPRDHALIN